MGGKKLGVPNGMGKAAKHEDLAELEAAEQLTCEDTVSSHPSNRDPASPPNSLVRIGLTL